MKNRRELLIASAAVTGGAGAALLASCGGGGKKTQTTETVSTVQMQGDAAILNYLLDLESSSIVAYADAAQQLAGRDLAEAKKFGAQEREHAAYLRRAITSLGQPVMPTRSDAAYRATFPTLHNAHDALTFVLDVENTSISAYADALPKVATLPIRVTLASILAAESEHASVLLGDLGRPQVPMAFVTGPPPQQDSG